MAAISGGEIIIGALQNAGVEHIFALHGAHIDPLFQACRDMGMALIDTRHECAAGHAAEGYARAGNRLGAVMVTAGPGFTNLVSSIANARLDQTPVIFLAGSAGLREAETNTLQAGIDQVAIAAPLAKWAHRITAVAELPRLIAHAIRVATTAPCGPVVLDLPKEVLVETFDCDPLRVGRSVSVRHESTLPADAVDEVLDLLQRAERPVLMAGVGLARAGGGAALAAFADAIGLPVYSDFEAHGLLAADSPNYVATFHRLEELTEDTGRPDLVLAIGVRFGLTSNGVSPRVLPLDAKLVHVVDDAAEIGRLRDPEIGLVANPRAFLEVAVERAGRRQWPGLAGWRATARQSFDRRLERLATQSSGAGGPIHPFQALRATMAAVGPDAMIVGDGAETNSWLNELVRQNHPGSYLTHGFLGCMGTGMGVALGVKAQAPDRPVILITGDGSIGFYMSEFDTMARHGLPIVTIVFNNHSWAASEHFQHYIRGEERVFGTHLGGARYDLAAEALGCGSSYVTSLDALSGALETALSAGRPWCINVEVELDCLPPELAMLAQIGKSGQLPAPE